MRAAWGNIPVVSLPTDMGDHNMFVSQNAATPDNQWLLGTVESYDYTTPPTQPAFVALYNIHTHQIQRIHTLLNTHSQVLGASVDDHWIAWSEADDPSYYDWTLFLYYRDTGQTIEVASAPKVNGQAIEGPNTPPVVSHGMMIWSQPIEPVKPGDPTSFHNAVVKLDDLSTGKIATVATGAGLSTLAWPWAAWGMYPTQSGAQGHMEIKNLQSGQDIYFAQQPSTLVLDGASVAYDDGDAAFLVNDITRYKNNPQQISASTNVEYVTLNDRLITWRQDSAQPVAWDRLFNRPVMLPEQNPVEQSEAWIAGNLLVWLKSQDPESTDPKPPVLQIIDTTTLPTSPATPS